MLLNFFFALAELIWLAQALAVPSKSGNSVHVAQRDQVVQGPFENSAPLPRSTSITKDLNTRDDPFIVPHVMHRACGFNMDPNDADQAINDLGAKIGQGNNLEQNLSANLNAVAGSVIAFICQHDTTNGMLIDTDYYQFYINAVKSACGEYIAGTYTVPDDSGPLSYGYMRYSPGLETHVCDHPGSASAQSCTQ